MMGPLQVCPYSFASIGVSLPQIVDIVVIKEWHRVGSCRGWRKIDLGTIEFRKRFAAVGEKKRRGKGKDRG